MLLIDKIREDKLIELAKTRFDPDLKPAELKVLRDSTSSEDLPIPGKRTQRPEVRADFIRWLATDPEATSYIDPKGIQIICVSLPGKLDLRECRVHASLTFLRCTFHGVINFISAEIKGLFVLDSELEGGIRADRIIVHGPLFLRGCTLSGDVRLLGAQVEGNLDCTSMKMLIPQIVLCADNALIQGNLFLSDVESSGEIRLLGAEINGQLVCASAHLNAIPNSLSGDNANIGDNVIFSNGFNSSGTLRFNCARIRGSLDCTGAKLLAPKIALELSRVEIGNDVFLDDGFESSGAVQLIGARIGGDLAFIGAKITQVICENLRLTGDLLWMGIKNTEKTYLDLAGAKVKNLCDDKMSWPEEGKLDVNGFVYEELTLHVPPSKEYIKARQHPHELPLVAKERIAWIMLQPKERRTEPQPWMQLRDLLERKGECKQAKYVLRHFHCLQAQKSWIPWRWVRKLYALLEEAPLRIGWSIALTLAIGTSIFTWGGSKQAMIETARYQPNMVRSYDEVNKPVPREPVSDHYPHFQPFVYTLENAVPLVKLGMDEKWTPNPSREFCQPWIPRFHWLYFLSTYGWLNFWRWALIVGGWVQATVLAASVADRFRK